MIEKLAISDKSSKFKVLNFRQITLNAMLPEDKVIEIFVMADEFCKILNAMLRKRNI